MQADQTNGDKLETRRRYRKRFRLSFIVLVLRIRVSCFWKQSGVLISARPAKLPVCKFSITANHGVGPAPALMKLKCHGQFEENWSCLYFRCYLTNIDKAVLEPTFCPMYALLCSDLNEKLPPFPSDEPGGKEITFKRILLNNCQEAFEGAGNLRAEISKKWNAGIRNEWFKLRTLGNMRLRRWCMKRLSTILFRSLLEPICFSLFFFAELIGDDSKTCPAEENVEAICQFFNTMGKKLDENPKARRLKELTTNPHLAPRLRFMVRNVLDVRANSWVPRQAEKNLGMRPGATAVMKMVVMLLGVWALVVSHWPAWLGGMMPGMPGMMKMPGMPGLDDGNWEVPRSRAMPRGNSFGPTQTFTSGKWWCHSWENKPVIAGQWCSSRPGFGTRTEPAGQTPKPVDPAVSAIPSPQKPLAPTTRSNPDDLRRKTISLLEEYFSVQILDEALQCVEELKDTSFHPEVAKELLCMRKPTLCRICHKAS
uniref:MI domain-containing protein n=1 Tax=Salix viminalis TaxID=40686 RepID=A0A6N2KNE4_SALVM